MDISAQMLKGWDLIAESAAVQALAAETGAPVSAEIEGMFISMAEEVAANRDLLSNMAPGMWADLVRAGRILERPGDVRTAIGRLRRMVTEQFFADGAWQEGAPSYHGQVVGGWVGELRRLLGRDAAGTGGAAACGRARRGGS